MKQHVKNLGRSSFTCSSEVTVCVDPGAVHKWVSV